MSDSVSVRLQCPIRTSKFRYCRFVVPNGKPRTVSRVVSPHQRVLRVGGERDDAELSGDLLCEQLAGEQAAIPLPGVVYVLFRHGSAFVDLSEGLC